MTCTRCHKPSKAKVCHACRGRMAKKETQLRKLTVWVEPGMLLALEQDVALGRARSLGAALRQRALPQ